MLPTSRIALGCAVAISLAGGTGALHLAAQSTQPIYLQYDGFVRNADGTLTLSFGYFNTNNADVSITPGDANSFVPAPPDRSQPVVFLKGRHRFACSMVVDKTFDGRLQWTVRFAGSTSTTTAKTLDPLYELELNSQKRANRDVDSSAAPRNVCLNRAPLIEAATSPFEAPSAEAVALQGKVGQELAINAHVEDDGLPRGAKVTTAWRKTSGPGDASFSDPSTATTRVTFSAPGTYELQLSASDGERSSTFKVTVHVAQ